MENRFKFNATVEGYFYIDTPEKTEELEPKILLKDVDILSDGNIGKYTDDIEKAINEQYPHLSYKEKEQILDNFKDNSLSMDPDRYLTINPEQIFQCTGKTDRHGNLIYEGDILRYYYETPDGEEYEDTEVVYSESELCFGLYDKRHNHTDLEGLGSDFESKDSEIIGNVYYKREK